ncbi:MAG: hypothetical protein IKN74_05295 [Clostridia bacterium]|nr:hypothetical protein [Clostridia bacterium]
MRRIIKNVSIVLLLLVILSSIITVTYAATQMSIPIDGVISAGSGAKGASSVKTVMGGAVVIAQVIAAGVAVIMLLVLAMKYMSAAPGEKAEIKKHAVIYVVGAIIMFAVTGILEIIKQFASNI